MINKAAHDCLQTPAVPSAKKSNQKRIPGWNDEVKPYKEMSRFWASVWKSAGRPINNGLHQIMKKSREQKGAKYRNMNNNALSEFKTEKPENPEKPEVRS